MRKIFTAILMFAACVSYAQKVDYGQRYEMLVSKFGPAGFGVETVLDNWAKADSADIKLLTARFKYYFAKAQTEQVVKKPQRKYLGMDPLITLKDSTGTDVYYYQEAMFDDEIYGQALKAADKAISMYPDYLDFRFIKANAYIAYEKESPDMALAYLLALADENATRRKLWRFDGKAADARFFEDAMQEYCASFYAIGGEKALAAFLKLSEKMNALHPDNMAFISNIGSYYMTAVKDYKTALKYYTKVLKKKPDDYTAIKNSMIAARKLNNTKLEKKYLQMIVKYGPENEKLQAQARLKTIS